MNVRRIAAKIECSGENNGRKNALKQDKYDHTHTLCINNTTMYFLHLNLFNTLKMNK